MFPIHVHCVFANGFTAQHLLPIGLEGGCVLFGHFDVLVWGGQRCDCSRGEQYVLRSSSGDYWGAIEPGQCRPESGSVRLVLGVLSFLGIDMQLILSMWIPRASLSSCTPSIGTYIFRFWCHEVAVKNKSPCRSCWASSVQAVFSQLVLSSGGFRVDLPCPLPP